jgi:hypothetical protein
MTKLISMIVALGFALAIAAPAFAGDVTMAKTRPTAIRLAGCGMPAPTRASRRCSSTPTSKSEPRSIVRGFFFSPKRKPGANRA